MITPWLAPDTSQPPSWVPLCLTTDPSLWLPRVNGHLLTYRGVHCLRGLLIWPSLPRTPSIILWNCGESTQSRHPLPWSPFLSGGSSSNCLLKSPASYFKSCPSPSLLLSWAHLLLWASLSLVSRPASHAWIRTRPLNPSGSFHLPPITTRSDWASMSLSGSTTPWIS